MSTDVRDLERKMLSVPRKKPTDVPDIQGVALGIFAVAIFIMAIIFIGFMGYVASQSNPPKYKSSQQENK